MFTLQLSIEFIIVILIGGAFSLHGAVLGAIFIVMIDPFSDLSQGRHSRCRRRRRGDVWRGRRARRPYSTQRRRLRLGERPERRDLRGNHRRLCAVRAARPLRRWLKIKLLFQLFPLYKRPPSKRQKIYVKSERNR